jgi:hypothetical protein
MIVSGTRLTAV